MSTQLDSPASRLSALRAAIGDSISAIQRAASIYQQMEAAGDDVTAVPPDLRARLRAINAGTLLPEVVVEFGGRLRAAVAQLPIATQRNMLQPDAVIPVALPDGDSVLVAPRRLTPAQVAQVFGPGYIRELGEQRGVLRRESPRKRGRPPGERTVEVKKSEGCVLYYGHTITKATILRWLNEL